jgi:hypothetical protein
VKTFSTEALAALQSGEAVVAGAVWFGGDLETGFWGGHGNIAFDGHAFIGLGDKGLVSASAGTLGGQEQGAQLELSGVDPEVMARLDLASLRGVPVVLYRLIFNGTGSTLLHAAVYLRGRVDRASTEETPGGAATLRIGVEGAARGLGRRSERMRTDADQQLILPGDTGLKRVAYAGTKAIYWGGKPPARAGELFGGDDLSLGRGGGGRGDPFIVRE